MPVDDPERTPASTVAVSPGIPCWGANMRGLDFNIAFLGLDVKMNADGALTRQLANEDLRARAAGRAFSSDVDVEQRDQDDAGGNDSRSDESQCDAIGRRR
jgi:hypothetical protein